MKGNFKAAIFLRHKVVEGVTSNEIDGILEIDLELCLKTFIFEVAEKVQRNIFV